MKRGRWLGGKRRREKMEIGHNYERDNMCRQWLVFAMGHAFTNKLLALGNCLGWHPPHKLVQQKHQERSIHNADKVTGRCTVFTSGNAICNISKRHWVNQDTKHQLLYKPLYPASTEARGCSPTPFDPPRDVQQ